MRDLNKLLDELCESGYDDASDLIEQQQACISELEQREAELERQREELCKERISNLAEISRLKQYAEEVQVSAYDSGFKNGEHVGREYTKQERDELAATVDRLKSECIDVLYDFAAERDGRGLVLPACDQNTPIAEAMEVVDSIPAANLNAVKLNSLFDFRHDCGDMSGYNAVDVWDKMDEYIKREFS